MPRGLSADADLPPQEEILCSHKCTAQDFPQALYGIAWVKQKLGKAGDVGPIEVCLQSTTGVLGKATVFERKNFHMSKIEYEEYQ